MALVRGPHAGPGPQVRGRMRAALVRGGYSAIRWHSQVRESGYR